MPHRTELAGARKRPIVVIDDDPALLRAIGALLRREGHEIHATTDPTEGIELVRKLRPHLVVLDYMMPVLDGADVIRAIRSFDRIVQILLITSMGGRQPGRKLLADLDIQDYHDKGDGPDRLLMHVDSALKHHDAIFRVERNRQRLMRMASAGPAISRLQSLHSLYQVALASLAEVLNIRASDNEESQLHGCLVLYPEDKGPTVELGLGKYQHTATHTEWNAAMLEAIVAGQALSGPKAMRGRLLVVPLRPRSTAACALIVEMYEEVDDPNELCSIFAQMIEQAIDNAQLYRQATVDGLTGAANRNQGLLYLERSIAPREHKTSTTSVLMLDIDHFKHVNDQWGHTAGDHAIVAVAETITRCVRRTDIVSRYGGEEFLVVLPGTDARAANFLAERIRAAVESAKIFHGDQPIPITVSIGWATATLTDSTDLSSRDLIEQADQALYRAKRAGRNRVEGLQLADVA